MTRTLSLLLLAAATIFLTASAQPKLSGWRTATERELKEVLPARATVEKERIETESRTATGVTNGHEKFIAGIVLITAGYSAEGKYSHYFVTQVPLKIGEMSLHPGEYVFGWKRKEDSLTVKFNEASTGKPMGTAEAHRNSQGGKIEAFRISPPGEKSAIQIGRFALAYEVEE